MGETVDPRSFDRWGVAGARLAGWMGLAAVPLTYFAFLVSAGPRFADWLDPVLVAMFAGTAIALVLTGYVQFRAETWGYRPLFDDQGIRIISPRFLDVKNTREIPWAALAAVQVQEIPERRDRGWLYWEPATVKVTLVRHGSSPVEIRVVGPNLKEWAKSLASCAAQRVERPESNPSA